MPAWSFAFLDEQIEKAEGFVVLPLLRPVVASPSLQPVPIASIAGVTDLGVPWQLASGTKAHVNKDDEDEERLEVVTVTLAFGKAFAVFTKDHPAGAPFDFSYCADPDLLDSLTGPLAARLLPAEPPPASAANAGLPGSEAKIILMQQRYEAGYALFRSDDPQWNNDAVARPGVMTSNGALPRHKDRHSLKRERGRS